MKLQCLKIGWACQAVARETPRLPESHPTIETCGGAELRFYAEELVVPGDAVGVAQRARPGAIVIGRGTSAKAATSLRLRGKAMRQPRASGLELAPGDEVVTVKNSCHSGPPNEVEHENFGWELPSMLGRLVKRVNSTRTSSRLLKIQCGRAGLSGTGCAWSAGLSRIKTYFYQGQLCRGSARRGRVPLRCGGADCIWRCDRCGWRSRF